jgi:hypothetical protein
VTNASRFIGIRQQNAYFPDITRQRMSTQLAGGVDRGIATATRREGVAPIALHGLFMQFLISGQERAVSPAPHILHDREQPALAQAPERLAVE